jgi:hypothetical protein
MEILRASRAGRPAANSFDAGGNNPAGIRLQRAQEGREVRFRCGSQPQAQNEIEELHRIIQGQETAVVPTSDCDHYESEEQEAVNQPPQETHGKGLD